MDKYKFGNKLTEYRTQKGLTQGELGEILGVSNKAVSKWENGSAMPRLDMMSKITDYFGVSMDEFLDIPSDKKTTDEELEQKYLKLYNEKMKRRKILRGLLFIVFPSILIITLLIYIFGPVILVKMKYNSMSEYAKIKPEKFDSYDLAFDYTTSFGKVGNVTFSLPDGTELFRDVSNVEKSYKKISVNGENLNDEEHFDVYHVLYSPEGGGLEHFDYILNWEDEWFSENYDGKHYRMGDLKWLGYNYDWKNNIKCCDWKKALMSYNLLTLWDVAAPISDRVIEYSGSNAKGFITVWNHNGVTTYNADLYNAEGESIGIVYTDANKNDTSDYKTFCMTLNSVVFTGEEVLDEEQRSWRDAYDMVERDWDRSMRWRDDLPYVTPNPDLEILKAEEVTTYSLKEGMTENDIIKTLGEPKEIEFVSEDGFNKKVYVYDGVKITFLKEYLGEAYMDEIWSAEFTDKDAQFPRDIKIGDSLESILLKLPQERDKDYRLDGKVYGDGMYKFTDGFAYVDEQLKDGEPQEGEYQLNVSCGYWPEIDFILDKDLNVESVTIFYTSSGIG